MTDRPVKIVERRLACANKVWNVWLDHVRDALGAEVRDYVVVAPQSPRTDLIAGVAVLPVADGKLGLLRSFRHPVDRWLWEVPRGFVDFGEEPDAAALRELAEETGLICASHDIAPMGSVIQEGSTISAIAALFVARQCHASIRSDDAEIGLGEMHWFLPAEVQAMLDASEILDACTVTLLYRYLVRERLTWS